MKRDDILHTRFNGKLKRKAKSLAKARQQSLADLVEMAVTQELGFESPAAFEEAYRGKR